MSGNDEARVRIETLQSVYRWVWSSAGRGNLLAGAELSRILEYCQRQIELLDPDGRIRYGAGPNVAGAREKSSRPVRTTSLRLI